jgi:hypothetical protein
VTEPRRDWPDVLPGAFTVTPRRAPFALALACAALVVLGLAAVASTVGATMRIVLTIAAGLVALAAVSLLFGVLQAGKPQLVADAAGIKTTLTPHRIPWERVERIRIMASRIGGGTRIGVIPTSLAETLGPRSDDGRVLKMLESRQRRDGAPYVVNLLWTGVTSDEARQRLSELAAGRTPITD